MNKLEVGMYVRTDKGLLGKLISKEKDGCGFILKYEGQYSKTVWSSLGTDDDIIKASYSIIDLVQVGDYVNGSEVLDFENKYMKENAEFVRFGVITENCYLENTDSWIIEKNIKSIVTKEQFSSMEYKVENEK